MKFLRKAILLLITLSGFLTSNCQTQNGVSLTRDSVINHFVKNGAWHYPIFSKGWGINIDSALEIFPKDAYLWQQKSMPFFKQMKYSIGMRYLDSAVKYSEQDFIEYRAFIKCIFQKNYIESIRDFNRARDIKGDFGFMDHSYGFYLGICYLQLNNFDSALYLFQRCVNEDKTKGGDKWIHPLRDFYLGIAYYEKDSFQKAIEIFTRAITNYSHFSDAKFYKGLCYAKKGNLNSALILLKEAENDFSIGYTINEDNSLYEKYPYQISSNLLKYYSNLIQQYLK